MVNERPRQFGGIPRFQPGTASHSQRSATMSGSPQVSRATQQGLGLGKSGRAGAGLGKTLKRHKKVPRDTIQGITQGDIRRLARRGGIKRISRMIYDDVRQALKERLERLLKDICAIVELQGRKTVSVQDVIFTLNRLGRPIYGFDPDFDPSRR